MTLSEEIRSGQSSREVMKLKNRRRKSIFFVFAGDKFGTESGLCRNKKRVLFGAVGFGVCGNVIASG